MAFLDTIKSMNPFGKKDTFDLDKELASLTGDSNGSHNYDMNQGSFEQGSLNQDMNFGNGQYQDQSGFSQDQFMSQNSPMNDPMGNSMNSFQNQMPNGPGDMPQNQMQGQPLYQEILPDENTGQFPESYPNQMNQSQPQFDPRGQVQMLTPAPLQDIDHKSIRMEKEIEVVQAKLDTLKAVLDSINQRLAHLEEQNRYKRNNW